VIAKIKNKIKGTLNKKVIYDETFFQDEWFKNWDCLKFKLKEIIDSLNKNNIADFGCGPGVMIDYMNSKGYNYLGCDYSSEAFELYKKFYGKNVSKYKKQLSEINFQNIDLIVSFDVFEHMTDEQIITFFEQTKEVKMYLLNISRQKGILGHINLKNDDEWALFFKQNSLKLDMEKTNVARETYLNIAFHPQDNWDKNMFVLTR
jgi:2-polyprenyl-3-methyl-5-hydroxy-6-metoxy-1,4-benzoquinol methylase